MLNPCMGVDFEIAAQNIPMQHMNSNTATPICNFSIELLILSLLLVVDSINRITLTLAPTRKHPVRDHRKV